MDTPEGKVKKAIREYLDSLGDACYHHWPVPVGYGASTVDCLMCYRGFFVAIEVKRPGVTEPTPWQEKVLTQVKKAEGISFTTNNLEAVKVMISDIDQHIKMYLYAR